MAIYRLSIEVLKADDEEAAIGRLMELRGEVREIEGMIVYPPNPSPDETWGAIIDPSTFVLDFDSDDPAAADGVAAELVAEFVKSRG